jgi:hypothetical protein
VADPQQEDGIPHELLRRTNTFAILLPVSSMSPLIWIQPANFGGLFFCPESEKKKGWPVKVSLPLSSGRL